VVVLPSKAKKFYISNIIISRTIYIYLSLNINM